MAAAYTPDAVTPQLPAVATPHTPAVATPHPPAPPTPLPTSPPRKRRRVASTLVDRVASLLRDGARQLDLLREGQMAAQEAAGVMAAAMLRQQAAMRDVSAWEMDAMEALREMASMVAEEMPEDL
jgi:hypothetical protein